MATLLSVTNKILRRLREDQVTETYANAYALLVADFVAEAYEDVAEEHDWAALYHEIIVDLVASQTVYDLSSTVALGGDLRNGVARACKPDSFLEYDDEDQVPSIRLYDDANDDSGMPLLVVSPGQLNALKSLDRDDTDDDPVYAAFYPDSTGQELRMEVWPSPTTARELRARFHTKPDDMTIDSNGTDDATTIIVPDRPVYALALMHAYNERGEELGEPGNIAERRYITALEKAMEADIEQRARSGRYDWRRD